MKKKTTLLAGTALMLGFAATANAVPTLTLTSGSVTVSGTPSLNQGIPGAVIYEYNGPVGDFAVNVSTGISAVGTSYLHLNSVDMSDALSSATLVIRFSDTGFNLVNPYGYNLQIGGLADGTINFSAYYDTGNNNNAETSQIGNTLTNPNNGAFSVSGTGLVTASGPFSLTEEISITHSSGFHVTSFDAALTPVPEPATMMLLGAGFLGLAIYGKRRKNA